jgi:hypothetical protein
LLGPCIKLLLIGFGDRCVKERRVWGIHARIIL